MGSRGKSFGSRGKQETDEQWLRNHLPKDIRNEKIDWAAYGMFQDGLNMMGFQDRGPATIVYQAKSEGHLRWWQLDYLCKYLGKIDKTKTWRWYRDHVENGHWCFIEHRCYDYNAIEDTRLAYFERYLRNLKYSFREDYFRTKVEEYTRLMNNWFSIPHWGYDYEKLCFIEISDSKEQNTDKSDEIKDDNVIRVVD